MYTHMYIYIYYPFGCLNLLSFDMGMKTHVRFQMIHSSYLGVTNNHQYNNISSIISSKRAILSNYVTVITGSHIMIICMKNSIVIVLESHLLAIGIGVGENLEEHPNYLHLGVNPLLSGQDFPLIQSLTLAML